MAGWRESSRCWAALCTCETPSVVSASDTSSTPSLVVTLGSSLQFAAGFLSS